jgi:hypothetical protein
MRRKDLDQYCLPTQYGKHLTAAWRSPGLLLKPLRCPLVSSTSRLEVHWFQPQASCLSASVHIRWSSRLYDSPVCVWSPWFLGTWQTQESPTTLKLFQKTHLSRWQYFFKARRLNFTWQFVAFYHIKICISKYHFLYSSDLCWILSGMTHHHPQVWLQILHHCIGRSQQVMMNI